MRVAWFTHRYWPCVGGAENYGREMVRRFVAHGHRADVFTSDADDLGYFTDRKRRRVDAPGESVEDGARVHRLAVRHIPAQRYVGKALSLVPHWPTRCRAATYLPILPGIERVRGGYDAAFAVGFPFTTFAMGALRTARAAGAPLVLTPFLHLATPGDPVNRRYTRPHQARLLAEADLVVVQTALEADAVAGWGLSREKILTLGMGVDAEAVTGGDRSRWRRELGIPEGRPVVGHLATLDPNKGTVDLVRAVERWNASRPGDDPIHLILAGPASAEFEQFAQGWSESTRRWVSRLGPLRPEGRPDFYAALDVFAMPSRTDSFGIVFLEAWANGLPVVASAAGGVVEVVRDGVDGRLLPFGDVAGLSGAIGTLVQDRALAQRWGEAGRTKVARGYSWDDRFATLLRGVKDASARLNCKTQRKGRAAPV